MTTPNSGAETSRRNFIGLVGLGAATLAGGPLLAGCGELGADEGSVQNLDKLSSVLPRFKDLTLPLPPPDVKGVRPIADSYTKYPTDILDAITEKPGTSGKAVKAMTPVWGPAPAGMDKNAYLQAVNAELGTPIDFTAGDGNTYADKLNAMFGARDVPDLLCVPSWEYPKIPKFAEAAQTLFEDLTPYLSGDKVDKYPMMACFPKEAWQHSVWAGKLMAIPNDTSFGFGWTMFGRQDLLEKQGLKIPTSYDELMETAKAVTNPAKKVWAFNDFFGIMQMYWGVPGSQGGWKLVDGKPVFKYETDEFKQAVEAMMKVYKDGLVHPDVLASKGADSKALFAPNGQIIFLQDGYGLWSGAQAEHQKVVPGLKITPVNYLSATGGTPIAHGGESPISFTFIKKGLGKERVEELLRMINWCSAPFGTQEYELRENGTAGKHHTATPNGPSKTDLGFKEIANQYFFVSGRRPVGHPNADLPGHTEESMAFKNENVKFAEKDPWIGIKLEMPDKYKASQVPTEEKVTDVLRGRRPVSDLDAIVKEWKANGGDEARELLAKALADAGR